MSFGIDAKDANTDGLRGFAVEQRDVKEGQRYFMYGFKVFPSVVPNPTGEQPVSTFDQPIQSFVWDDFTAKEDRTYEYFFHPHAHPTAEWIANQITQACGWKQAPRYLIRDRDGAYGEVFYSKSSIHGHS